MTQGRAVTALSGHASISDVVAIADRAVEVSVEPAAYEAVSAAHAAAEEISARIPTYGRTTGVGANRLTAVSGSDSGHGTRLLRSHAADAGTALPDRTVRAMLAVRLNQLCVPGAGLDPRILTGLQRMLNDDALPTVLEYGSIGTGDLAALAGTALTLMGERPASRPLAPMEPWGVDSALPFMSSSAQTIGRACLSANELTVLDRASSAIYALSFLALDGNDAAFSATAAQASAAPGVEEVAARLRELLRSAGTARRTAARIQDPYGLRVYAIAQAGMINAVGTLSVRLTALLNAAQENPLFDFDGDAVVHHGAFYQAALSLALDGSTLAVAQTAAITLSRIRMLNEPSYNGGRPFLATGPAGASGLMMVEYVAAGAIAELRNAASPASVGTLVLSRGAEDDASFASQGAVELERSVAAYRVLLSCELVGAMRLLRSRGLAAGAHGVLDDVMELVSVLPSDDGDRDLRVDLAMAEDLLEGLGSLMAAP